MVLNDRLFRFESGAFQAAVAHDGTAPIFYRRVVAPEHGSAYRWIDLVCVPIGADIGIHTHEDGDEEVYIVIAGQGRMSVDGAFVDVGPGDVIINRPGGTHGLVNTGDVEMRLVVVDAIRLGEPQARAISKDTIHE